MLLPPNIINIAGYIAPPIMGAFIGYLTNRIAIKMLFRPLKAYYFLGMKIPMTPGVIPAKREEFAENMGGMVGDHLLTSKEINQALNNKSFQDHLYRMIEDRVGGILNKDLGPLPTIVPKKLNNYFDNALQTVTQLLQNSASEFINSTLFNATVSHGVDSWINSFVKQDIDAVVSDTGKMSVELFIRSNIQKLLKSKALDEFVEQILTEKVNQIIANDQSLSELLPEDIQQILLKSVEHQTPFMLSKLGQFAAEPEIRGKIAKGVRSGVESFIESLGPMGAMVSGFITMDTIEDKAKEYLSEHEEDLENWLQSDEVKAQLGKILNNGVKNLLATPLVELCEKNNNDISIVVKQLSETITSLMRGADLDSLSSIIQKELGGTIVNGSATVDEALGNIFGDQTVSKAKDWIKNEVSAVLRSDATVSTVNNMIEMMISNLLTKPIGRLSNFLPTKIRESIYMSLRTMANDMLLTEVPGIVKSLNLKNVITEKINSLNLLKLEKLLLSIMQEQFKYINLFGALLGFMIGSLNLIFLL